MRRGDRFKAFVCIGAGASMALAFAPFGYAFLAPVSLAVLFSLWVHDGPKAAFIHGLLFGLACYTAGLYWIHISVHEFGQAPLALSLLLMFGVILLLAFVVAATGALARSFFAKWRAASLLLAMPALWVLTEWIRNWAFSGFGWLSVGYSQTDTWLMGLAPVVGMHGMSCAVALTAGALASVATGLGRERKAALIVLAAVWGAAWLLDERQYTAPMGDSVDVALVQGAVSQDRKWLVEQYSATLALYRALTFATQDRDLVVWPEVAVPNLYGNARAYLDDIETQALARDMTVMLGILRQDAATGSPQNVVVALTGERQFYAKRHLVPFGEYFPVPAFVREWLRLMSLPYSDITAGAQEQALIRAAGQQIAVTICYEDVFGFEQLSVLPEASLLVNVSNDAWFGDSSAPHQHLQIARLRAAEAGRYLLRATNTGISAVIGPLGDVVVAAPQFQPAVLEAAVEGHSGRTPYSIWGNFPVILLAALALAVQSATTKLTMRPGI